MGSLSVREKGHGINACKLLHADGPCLPCSGKTVGGQARAVQGLAEVTAEVRQRLT